MAATHSPGPLVFLHVGDLHLTRRGAANAGDLRTILAQIASIAPRTAFDFVYLPGDIAEDGYRAQYAILEDALAAHPGLTVRLIPGDHDRQHGAMAAFAAMFRRVMTGVEPVTNHLPRPEAMRPVEQYYYEDLFAGVRCIFLDMVSAGYGRKGFGLDFRLDRPQRQWLEERVVAAGAAGEPCAVFMHTYPDDLHLSAESAGVAGLFWSERVRLVEMGHTHYNDLAPDGRTLYAAARSVGQNEDGSVGYAVAAIDGDAISWRFRALDRTWPFVMITSPADRRVATGGLVPDRDGTIAVRALVLSDQPDRDCTCACRVDDGPWRPMTRPRGERCFTARVPWPEESRTLSVQATDGRFQGMGHRYVDGDTIEPAPPAFVAPSRPERPGSDAFSLPAWPAKGLRGDKLGPNRNGRDW